MLSQKGVFIIAEAGVNHNGDISIAKQLVDAAVNAGADAVKFQSFKAENLASKSSPKARYQLATTSKEESHQQMLRRLELSQEDTIKLMEYCLGNGIIFMSTPFDIESARFLKELKMPIWKLSSGAITDYPLLKEVGSYKGHIILSTGMATMREVSEAISVLEENGAEKRFITLLHCNTEYPTPFQDVNLKAMISLKEAFGVDIGYSDHTLGIEVPVAAVALGALVIEKHLTLDRSMEGPDHRASMETEEFKTMIKAIRNIELALGDGIKRPSKSEEKNIVIARKSIVASRQIEVGEAFSDENITCKRPGNGISPMKWPNLLGRKAKRKYLPDELIDAFELE